MKHCSFLSFENFPRSSCSLGFRSILLIYHKQHETSSWQIVNAAQAKRKSSLSPSIDIHNRTRTLRVSLLWSFFFSLGTLHTFRPTHLDQYELGSQHDSFPYSTSSDIFSRENYFNFADHSSFKQTKSPFEVTNNIQWSTMSTTTDLLFWFSCACVLLSCVRCCN